MKHKHTYQRRQPGAKIEACSACGKWRYTGNAGPAIVGVPQTYRAQRQKRRGKLHALYGRGEALRYQDL